MTGKIDKNNKNMFVIFLFGVFLFTSMSPFWINPKNLTLLFFPLQSAKNETLMTDRNPDSTALFSTISQKDECTTTPNQTVVEWKHMYWFPCKLAWKGICIWPIRRRHITYKVTLNEGTPLLDESGNAVPVARGKVRDWSVYNSEDWNALENNPKEKNRYPDYETIASNEFVVLVETRYRLFNDVESTLGICVQEP